MADPAKPTVASLATNVDQLAEDVRLATDSASTANEVTAALGKDITRLKEEQVKLAQLVNGLDRKPGDAVRPDKTDNILARLEAVERAKGQDWTPLFEAHSQRQGELAVAVKNLHNSLTAMEDKTGAQPGGPFEDLARDLEELKALVTRHGETINRLESAPDSGEWRSTVANDLRNLDSRLGDVAQIIAAEPVLASRAPAGHTPSVGGVHVKMLRLMDEVTSISKDRLAKGGGISYKFRGIEDAQNAVGAAMRKVRVLLRPEVTSWEHSTTPVLVNDDKGTKTVLWSTSKLTMRYVFVDPVDGSEFAVEMVGEGKDNSDKSASKAASMACKYALFQALMIPFEEVDESDGNHVVEENHLSRQTSTPGARVNRGEITPARAVQEYTKSSTVVAPAETGYDPAGDRSAMAGAIAPDESSLTQKAAVAARYLQEAVQQPAEVALPAIRKVKDKVAGYGIGDYEVDGITLDAIIATALQNVSAGLSARTGGGAQGVTRAGQQAGEGARARAAEHEPEPGSKEEYEVALTVLASSTASEHLMDQAMRIAADYERAQVGTPADVNPGPGGTGAGDHDY